MRIAVTSGVGKGQTKLSAFDAALWDAGIANLNLIKLSSMVPSGASVVIGKADLDRERDFGKKLYVVLSQKGESETGREAWAGLGWVQGKDGHGMFVEQEGSQEDEVVRLINETLEDMTRYRKDGFGKIHCKTSGIRCEGKPVCAVVAAVYQVENWIPVERVVGVGDGEKAPMQVASAITSVRDARA